MNGAPNSSSNRTILIVTEDVLYGDLLRYGLVASGYDAEVVESGSAAKAAVERTPPDVVVLDLFMAVTDGFRLLHSIRDDDKVQCPVLVLITAENPTLSVEVMVAGAADVCLKPVGFPEILESIEGFLGGDDLDPDALLAARAGPG